MSQFSVYANRGKGSAEFPYLLDVQSELLSKYLPTRVVAPLVLLGTISHPVLRLHVPVTISGKEMLVLFDQLAAVDARKLGKPVSSLGASYADRFKTALDVLFFNYP